MFKNLRHTIYNILFEVYCILKYPFGNTKWLYGIWFLLLVLLLINNNNLSFWEEDEAAYAAFAKQMLESDNWVNPEFLWADIHRKTPFHFWTIAISTSVFGFNEWAVRLPSVLAILATCMVVFTMGRRALGNDWAAISSLVLSSSFLLPVYGKIAFVDASLLLTQTIAILAILNLVLQPSWKWNVLFWASISIGILLKGPPIVILAGGIWLGILIFHPLRRNLFYTHIYIFAPLALLPFIAWAYLSYQQDGGIFLQFLYEWYITKRVGGSVLGQSGYPGYHLAILIGSFLAWLPFIVHFINNWKRIYCEDKAIFIFMLIALTWSWLFYELMTSKLPSYSLAAQPLFAILIARSIKDWVSKLRIGWVWGISMIVYFVIWILIAIAIPIVLCTILEGAFWASILTSVAILVSLGIVLLGVYYLPITLIWGMYLLSISFQLMVWWRVMPIIEASPIKSIKRLIVACRQTTKDSNKQLLLVGFSSKQTKISFPLYGKIFFQSCQEATVEQAQELATQGKSLLCIIGEDKQTEWQQLIEQQQIISTKWSKPMVISWLSTDDKLKDHPFWITCANVK